MPDHVCPDCLTVLMPGGTACPCGWRAEKKQKIKPRPHSNASKCFHCGALGVVGDQYRRMYCGEHKHMAGPPADNDRRQFNDAVRRGDWAAVEIQKRINEKSGTV